MVPIPLKLYWMISCRFWHSATITVLGDMLIASTRKKIRLTFLGSTVLGLRISLAQFKEFIIITNVKL